MGKRRRRRAPLAMFAPEKRAGQGFGWDFMPVHAIIKEQPFKRLSIGWMEQGRVVGDPTIAWHSFSK